MPDNFIRFEDNTIRKRWYYGFIITLLTILGLSIAIICVANIRNEQLYNLLNTYPGARSLYLGHDLSTGFAAFALALSLVGLVYSIFKLGGNKYIQAGFIFSFGLVSILACVSGIIVLFSANGEIMRDEPKFHEKGLNWDQSTSWDWMTQTFYYEYESNNFWKQLQSENKCCGVRGAYERGAIRSLWVNHTDLFSVFTNPTDCCKLTDDYECRLDANIYQEGCYWAVAWYEFIPLGALTLSLSAVSMFLSALQTYFYVFNHRALYRCC